MSYFLSGYRRYADFKGRSSRSEYWYFGLFFCLALIILIVLDMVFGLYNQKHGLGIISSIFVLVSFIPSIALHIRRLHDIGQSGWLYLIIFIPVVGMIAAIILGFIDSEEGNNEYGSNPKHI